MDWPGWLGIGNKLITPSSPRQQKDSLFTLMRLPSSFKTYPILCGDSGNNDNKEPLWLLLLADWISECMNKRLILNYHLSWDFDREDDGI